MKKYKNKKMILNSWDAAIRSARLDRPAQTSGPDRRECPLTGTFDEHIVKLNARWVKSPGGARWLELRPCPWPHAFGQRDGAGWRSDCGATLSYRSCLVYATRSITDSMISYVLFDGNVLSEPREWKKRYWTQHWRLLLSIKTESTWVRLLMIFNR